MKSNINSNVCLGKNCQIDNFAFIGQHPLRRIPQYKVIIGDKAICLRESIIYLDSRIGNNLFLAYNAIICEGNTIDDNFKLWSNSIVNYRCKIDDNVKVYSNIYIAQFAIIEDGVFLTLGLLSSTFSN